MTNAFSTLYATRAESDKRALEFALASRYAYREPAEDRATLASDPSAAGPDGGIREANRFTGTRAALCAALAFEAPNAAK
jgi:hypothetical protein